jgi:hypothetical protein
MHCHLLMPVAFFLATFFATLWILTLFNSRRQLKSLERQLIAMAEQVQLIRMTLDARPH